MRSDALLLLCTFGGAAIGSIIDRFMGGLFATALGICAGFVVYAFMRRKRGGAVKPKLVRAKPGR